MTSEGTTTQAREEAQRVAGTAGEEARQVTEQAKSEVRSLAEDARSRTMDMASDTGRRLKDEADGQVTRAASAMRSMSGDLRAMSEAETSSGSEGMPSQLARSAADWMDQTAGRLEQDGLDGIISDAERFARRNPAAFMAVAAGAGLLVGRLVRNAPKGGSSGNGSGGQSYGRPRTERVTGTGIAGSEVGAPPATTTPTTPTTAPTTPPSPPLSGGAPRGTTPDLGGGRTP
jgi:hypothetical protein